MHSNPCSSPHLPSQMSPWKHPVTPFEQPVRELSPESEVKRAQQSWPQLTTRVYTVHACTCHKTQSNQTGSVHKAYIRTYSSTGRLCYCTSRASLVVFCVCVRWCACVWNGWLYRQFFKLPHVPINPEASNFLRGSSGIKTVLKCFYQARWCEVLKVASLWDDAVFCHIAVVLKNKRGWWWVTRIHPFCIGAL